MRVVISGYYGYGNTGDEAILAGILRTFRESTPGLRVTVISGDPPRTTREHAVEAIPRMHVPAIASAIRASSGLLSGGGGLLQDRTSSRPVAYYAGVTQLARLLGRPYVVHAQGLGPIVRSANRRLAAVTLRGAAYCSLRDEGSVALARRIGVRGPIDLVPDPALALEPTAGERPGQHLVIAIRSWPSVVDYLTPIRHAVEQLARDIPVVALPMHEPNDRESSMKVVIGIPNATVAPRDLGLEGQLEIIGRAAAVVGMRLHSLILAAAAGVPALAISYDPKVDAFAACVGQPVLSSIERPFTAEALMAAVRSEFERDVGPYRARVSELRSGLQQAARAALTALGDDQGATIR